MALWNGLGQAATVAQLVGADVGGLISMIVQSALTARQNRTECEQLARRVLMIAQLLPHVQDREAAAPLAGLGDTLREAHELVVCCQGRSAALQFVMAGRQAERFREVQSKIDSYLILFPIISHIGITRRLERIYNILVPDESGRDEPPVFPQLYQQQEYTQVAQEVLPHRIQEFKSVEIVAATNNFALDTVVGSGSAGTVYRGRLHDGREVAVKRIVELQSSHPLLRHFCMELDILSRLRHKNIICLLGSCVTRDKRLLTRRRKEPEGLIVYEYMENGTLYDHLHLDQCSSMLSPVRVSWKVRIDVLLGVSRAIEHLHCHANPRIIHRDIKSGNILLDASWVPRVSDFGLSVPFYMESEDSGLETGVISTLACLDLKRVHTRSAFHMESEGSGLETRIIGTLGYIDLEYIHTGVLKPTSDVYNLGVLMLEVLTGKKAYSQGNEEPNVNAGLASFALPVIEAGKIEELLDRRPMPEPTPGQLQALEHVAQTAQCCLKLDGKDRLPISDIVANLEMARELICRDEPSALPQAPCPSGI